MKKRRLKKWVKIVLVIIILVIILLVNKKSDDDFTKDCTKHHNYNYCMNKIGI